MVSTNQTPKYSLPKHTPHIANHKGACDADGYVLIDIKALKPGRTATLILIVSVLLFLRRPDQFIDPSVWNESGSDILPNYIKHGLGAFFQPIAGYLVTIPKVIDGVSLLFGIYLYPYIAAVLTYLFTIATALLIYKSPTHLNNKYLCAVIPFIIPNGSEVYMVSLYTFWWGIIWIALALLWKETQNSKSIIFNNLIAVMGSLSSPMGIVFGPIFFARMLIKPSLQNISLVVSVGTTALIQFVLLMNSNRLGGQTSANPFDYILDVGTFFTFFIAIIDYDNGAVSQLYSYFGLICVLALCTILYMYRKRFTRHFLFLVSAAILSVVSYLVLTGPGLIHPMLAGPRYLFIPMSLFGWVMVWAMSGRSSRTRIALYSGLGALWLAAAPSTFWRTHDNIEWSQSVTNCFSGHSNVLPVHYEGDLSSTWRMEIPVGACEQFLSASIFDRLIYSQVTPPEVVLIDNMLTGPAVPASWVEQGGWTRDAVFDTSVVDVVLGTYAVFGSFINGDQFAGDLVITVEESTDVFSLLYVTGPGSTPIEVAVYGVEGDLITRQSLSGPSDLWSGLTIAGSLRPGMRIVVSDTGSGWGQWGAIGTGLE